MADMEEVDIKEEGDLPAVELEEEELELPKLLQEEEFPPDSRPNLITAQGRILVDAYGFYKKLDPDEVCPDVPQVAAQNVVRRYTLVNRNKVSVQIINYGATIVSVVLPDRDGNLVDVALGLEEITDYVCEKELRMGSTIGRYAGLISDAEFCLGPKQIYLSTNKARDHTHGGCLGFDSVLWDSYVRRDQVVMSYSSYPGEEGYPGQLMVQVSFSLGADNALTVQTQARCSLPTPVCIAHQPYFNLAGHGAGPEGLKEHCIMINADRYVVTDQETGRPTGELRSVGGTYYDLRVPRNLGRGIERAPNGHGYNLVYCLTKGAPKTSVTFAARLVHPGNGRYVEVLTDQPGLLLYTCGDLPNPDLPPPTDDTLPEFFTTDTVKQDDDGIDPELLKTMDKLEWPRPASLPEDDHVVADEEAGTELVPEIDERCETPPPRDQDLEDPDYFPREDIEDCPAEADISDVAQSIHEEDDVEKWRPPEPIHGKCGAMYRNDGAVVLMPMEYPDSVKQRRFPNPMLYPGEVYSRTVVYKFGVAPLRSKESPAKLLEQLLSSMQQDMADLGPPASPTASQE